MDRRSFIGALASTLVLDPERALYVPGAKLISIPAPRVISAEEAFLLDALRRLNRKIKARYRRVVPFEHGPWPLPLALNSRQYGVSWSAQSPHDESLIESSMEAMANMINQDHPGEHSDFYELQIPPGVTGGAVATKYGLHLRLTPEYDYTLDLMKIRIDTLQRDRAPSFWNALLIS